MKKWVVKSAVFLAIVNVVGMVFALLPVLNFLVFVAGLSLFFAGCWQLDLLAAQAFWNLDTFIRDKDKPFLLPFNVPLSKQMAYCFFFSWIGIGLFLVMFALIC